MGEVRCPHGTSPVEKLGDEDGHQHLMSIRKFVPVDDWWVEFELEDKIVRVWMAGENGTEVHIVDSYMDTTEHRRSGLVVRRRAERTVFDTLYTCTRK